MGRLYEQERRSITEIATLTDRSTSTVHRAVRLAGVEMRPVGRDFKRHPRALSTAEIDRTVALYASGMTTEEVAGHLGLTQTAARHRLAQAGVLRTRAEALRMSTRVRRLPAEVEDAIVERYAAGGSCLKVGRELGISPTSVSTVLARRGITARKRRGGLPLKVKRPELRAVDREHVGSVPSGPLAVMLVRAAFHYQRTGMSFDDGRTAICERAGIHPRQLLAWHKGEYERVRLDVADRVLQRMGWLWWDVYDPQAHAPGLLRWRQRDDVLAWIDAVDTAARLWDGEAATGAARAA